MFRKEFLIAFVKRILLFGVVIPGAWILAIIIAPFNGSGAALGIGMIGYFVGIPIWIVCASLAMGSLFSRRMRAIGVPGAIALIVILFGLADWKFFLWMFRPFHAPFFLTIMILIIGLSLWPDRTTASSTRRAPLVALGCCLAVQVILALATIVGSAIFIFKTSSASFLLESYASHYGLRWNVAIAAAMIWVLIEARRSTPDETHADLAPRDPQVSPDVTRASSGQVQSVFGKR